MSADTPTPSDQLWALRQLRQLSQRTTSREFSVMAIAGIDMIERLAAVLVETTAKLARAEALADDRDATIASLREDNAKLFLVTQNMALEIIALRGNNAG